MSNNVKKIIQITDEVSINFNTLIRAISRFGKEFGEYCNYGKYNGYEVIDNDLHFYYTGDDETNYILKLNTSSQLIKEIRTNYLEITIIFVNKLTGLTSEYSSGSIRLFRFWINPNECPHLYKDRKLSIKDKIISSFDIRKSLLDTGPNTEINVIKSYNNLAIQLSKDLRNDYYEKDKIFIVDTGSPDTAIILVIIKDEDDNYLDVAQYAVQRKRINTLTGVSEYHIYKVIPVRTIDARSYWVTYFVPIIDNLGYLSNYEEYHISYTKNGKINYYDHEVMTIKVDSNNDYGNYYSIFKYIYKDKLKHK